MMQLYCGPLNLFGAKVEIAAREKALSFEVIRVPFSIASRYEPKHPEVLRINPKQQVPVLVDGELEIFDSTQIFEYFEHLKPEPPLWPEGPVERARARLLELKVDEVFFPNVSALFSQRQPNADHAKIAAARAAIDSFYDQMENALIGKTYLCGPFTYADIGLFVAQFYGAFLGSPIRAKCERLSEWVRRLAARSSIQKTVGEMTHFLKENRIPVPIESGFSNA